MSHSILVTAVLAITGLGLWALLRRRRQSRFIDSHVFHPLLADKVRARYPHLDSEQAGQVIEGLRAYFHLCHRAGRRMVAMPSQAVDVAWHEFILCTRAYDQFSRRALGRFLHHTPAEAMQSPTVAQEGIKRAWRLSCSAERIDPRAPDRLPLLFAIDALLAIPDGFHYVPDCLAAANDRDAVYCAGHIGCTSCGGDAGDSSGCGGD